MKDAYDIIIDNHFSKHAIITITITSIFNNLGIDIFHINKIMEEMANIYAKLLNKYKFKYLLTFLAIFNK